jgi:hypothetical protein
MADPWLICAERRRSNQSDESPMMDSRSILVICRPHGGDLFQAMDALPGGAATGIQSHLL